SAPLRSVELYFRLRKMKPYAIVLSLALLAFAHGIFAQRVSTKSFQVEIKPECVGTENSKALKQLEAARDRKNDKEKRMDALRKTIELDPDCAEAHYYYGLELLR